MRLIGLIVLCVLLTKSSLAQSLADLSTLRQKLVWPGDTIVLDAQPIIPGSLYISINGQHIDASLFQLNTRTNVFTSAKSFQDSFLVFLFGSRALEVVRKKMVRIP